MQEKLLSANAVRTALGDVSDMTLWRWLQDATLGFPRPIYIGARRYWKSSELEDWIAKRSRAA